MNTVVSGISDSTMVHYGTTDINTVQSKTNITVLVIGVAVGVIVLIIFIIIVTTAFIYKWCGKKKKATEDNHNNRMAEMAPVGTEPLLIEW